MRQLEDFYSLQNLLHDKSDQWALSMEDKNLFRDLSRYLYSVDQTIKDMQSEINNLQSEMRTLREEHHESPAEKVYRAIAAEIAEKIRG